MLRIAFLYREEKQEWNEWEKFYYSQLSRVQVRVRFSSVEIKNSSEGKEKKSPKTATSHSLISRTLRLKLSQKKSALKGQHIGSGSQTTLFPQLRNKKQMFFFSFTTDML